MTPSPENAQGGSDSSTTLVTVEQATYDDLRCMLGAYFPSLPRVLECHAGREGGKPTLRLARRGGEAVNAYCRRTGPLSITLACALVYRLTAELSTLHTHFTPASVSIDLGSTVVDVWQDEFLHLRVAAFDIGETPRPAASQTLGLLQMCRGLITGGSDTIPDGIASSIPSTLLMHLRLLDEDLEHASLSWSQLKNVLLDTIATHGRTLRSASLVTHLAVEPHRLPAGCTPPPALSHGTIRLSRFLAQREVLTPSEVAALMPRLKQVCQAAEGLPSHCEPSRVLIKLPANLSSSDPKSLDMRLDSSAEFEVSLERRAGDEVWSSSPILALEAAEENHPFEDLRTDPERQLRRLAEVSLTGFYGLRRYDRSTPPAEGSAESFRLARPDANAAPTEEKDAHDGEMEGDQPETEPAVADAPALMKPIVLTLGSGGTGKSMLARLLYDFARLDERLEIPLFDCDVEGNRDFQKIDPERIQSVETSSTELIRLFVGAVSPEHPVFADLPSSCLQRFASELNPEIVTQLKEEAGISWLPVHLLTARASSVPVLMAWRQQLWGEIPSVIIVSQKDGQVPPAMVEKVVRPQDTVIRLPLLDAELAAATDLAAATWRHILKDAGARSSGTFANPLLKLQLKKKRDDFERALRPLVTMLAVD